jgi:hypothetical protein
MEAVVQHSTSDRLGTAISIFVGLSMLGGCPESIKSKSPKRVVGLKVNEND